MPNAVKAKLNRLQAEQRAPKVKIRKGDRVLVITGANRGDTGRVIEVDPRKMVARVEGIRMVKKHQRPDRARNQKGGIVDMEAPIHLSNLKVLDPTTGKADRVGRKILEDGTIVRYAKKSGAVLDKQG
jgi:large subunit ribosomal protein L24